MDLGIPPQPPVIHHSAAPANSDAYELTVYDDSTFSFHDRFRVFPHAITDGQTVFVDARISTYEPDYTVVLQNCWLSDSAHGSMYHGIPLIQNSCVRDNTLQWYANSFESFVNLNMSARISIF